ncbi:MAG: hypothetical protein WBZ29_15655 [Methanocella sp.]
MTDGTTIKRDWLLRSIGKLAIYTFPPLGLLGILGLVALKQYQFLILGIYMLVPIICAPLVYLAIRNRKEAGADAGSHEFKLLLAGFLLFFSFSVALLYAFDIRPVLYYVVIAAMATIILLEILRSEITQGKTIVILLQIFAMSLNISWGVALKYFEFIGRTDILLHSSYVQEIVNIGYVTSTFDDYQPFPLWHILSAGIDMVSGEMFPAYQVMQIAGAIAFALLPVFIYLICTRLLKEERIALVAALVISFFPDMVIMGMSTIASVIAQILTVFLVFLLLSRKGYAKYVLIVPLTAAIVFYHSVSILFVLVVLLILYVLQALFIKKQERFVSLTYIAFATLLTAAYWELNAGSIIQRLTRNLTAAPSNTFNMPTALAQNQPLNELFNYLQYVPSLLLILAGAFLLLRSDRFGSRARAFGMAALMVVWVSVPGPLLLIGKLAQNFSIDRFADYTFLILIPVCAVGLASLYMRSGKYGRAIVIGLFTLWVLLAVSNDWVASDNPLVKRPFYTFYFSGQEITGMDRLVTHATGILQSDYVPNRYYESSAYEPNTTILEVDTANMTFVRGSPEDVLLIRDGEREGRELRVAALDSQDYIPKPEGDYFAYVTRDKAVWSTLPAYNRIYDSRAIRAYN